MVASATTTTTAKNRHSTPPSTLSWCTGMFIASVFSMVYFVAPFYMLASLFALIKYTYSIYTWIMIAPLVLSAVIPPMGSPALLRRLKPMLDYFEYEEIMEKSPIDVNHEILKNDKNYLCVCQPHGTLSYTGICSAVNGTIPEYPGRLLTAVADAVLYTPILKHVLGIFGLVSASKKSLQAHLANPGVDGCIVLYVGGMAELFLSSEHEETLYLNKRKGFIKLALTQGVDVVPIYLFGNTSVLSVLKKGILSTISRKSGVSLTYIWGKYYLPIPRDLKLLYVSGQPIGIPKLKNPTQADIDKWHAKYCAEVTRLFNTYKERVPEYKHKTLKIV